MRLAKVVLWLGALVLAGFGVGFLVAPVEWASVVDIQLPTATARTDVRATYGGFDLAVGVFLAICALRAEWIRPGLAGLALAAAGYGGGRLFGILVEGAPSPLMVTFATIELGSALIAFLLFRRVGAAI